MDLAIVTYTFIGLLFICVGGLFCQCCMMRMENDIREPVYLYEPVIPSDAPMVVHEMIPSAPPLDYVRLAEDIEEPTGV